MGYKDEEKFKTKHRIYRQRNKNFVYNYLHTHPCVKCGYSDIRALDFDHINKEDKKENIKVLMNGTVSIVKLQSEIDKCQVLCANCHRIKTMECEDFRSPRNQPSLNSVKYEY